MNLEQRKSPTMKLDPKKLNALTVQLHGREIGIINRLGGDRHIFAFEEDYIDDPARPTLSKGEAGGLVTSTRVVAVRLPTFFSNLLLEGHLRTYLAARGGVEPQREFFLLAVLGAGLAGALVVAPREQEPEGDHYDGGGDDDREKPSGARVQ
jgi:serine/threonine-protein kinase HipA